MNIGKEEIIATAKLPLFLALYVLLTVWIFVGPALTSDQCFSTVRNIGFGVLLITGAWAFWRRFIESWQATKAHPLLTVGSIFAGLALMGVASGVGYAAELIAGGPKGTQNQAAIEAEVLNGASSFFGSLLFFSIGGIVAPIVEELVFREFPLGRIRPRLHTWAAFVLSCLVFGTIHLRSWEEWPLGVFYVSCAAALATAYLVSKRNILVSIAAHVLWNGTGLVYLFISAHIT